MTRSPALVRAAASVRVVAVVRVAALVRMETRLHWRYGIVALVGGLAAAWSGLLLALPTAAARATAPWLLLVETALVGTTLAGALVILERDQGMRAALAATPTTVGQRLAVKAGVLTALVTAAAVPVALAGRPPHAAALLSALAGVALIAALTLLLATALAAYRQSVITFMVALPVVLLPLLLPALSQMAGLTHPLLYAAPTTVAADLIQAGYGAAAAPWWQLGWPVSAVAAAAWLAHRQLRRVYLGRYRRRGGATAPVRRRGGPLRSFLAADLAGLRRDPLLLVLAASPVLLGLGLRLGYQPVREWLASVHGFDLDPYRPVLLGVAVLIHVPVTFGMVGALLVLDDVDDRALRALRTSPLSLPRYLAYRCGLVAVAAGLGVAVAVPLSGLTGATPAPLVTLLVTPLLAALAAPLFLVMVLAVARDKVEGMAAIKLLGLPFYASAVAWWLPGPAGWLLAWLPTWWLLRAAWHGWPYAVGGAAVMAALALAVATRRVLPRLAAL